MGHLAGRSAPFSPASPLMGVPLVHDRPVAGLTGLEHTEGVSVRGYTVEQVDRALLEAAVSGNLALACRRLAAQDPEAFGKLASGILRQWRDERFPRRYEAIAHQHAPSVERHIMRGARETAAKLGEVISLGAEKAKEQLEAGEVKNVAGMVKDLSVAFGIQVDKSLLLDGRPTSRVEHRSVDDRIRANLAVLKRAGLVVDGTAEDVTPSPSELPVGT